MRTGTSPYRYIACLRCWRVFPAQRRTRLTCSNKCKVWLSRHPDYRREWEDRVYPF